MTEKQKIAEILKAYTKKHNIMASSVILEAYAEELLANGVFILPEDLRGTEDFSISAFIEAMQMYEEKDRYIKPPCKVGDTVWEVNTDNPFDEDLRVMETKVERFFIGTSVDLHCMDCVGKTVFLTKEEAEEKLKELTENDR